MSAIDEFLKLLEIPEDDALAALLSAFGPPQPGALCGAWKKSAYFGNSAPETATLWKLLEESDFRCTECRSTLRLSFDHVDGDATNHATENLRVVCFKCNRRRVGEPTTDINADRPAVALYKAAIAFYHETGRIPANVEIERRAGVKTSGATYMLKLLRHRLNPKIES